MKEIKTLNTMVSEILNAEKARKLMVWELITAVLAMVMLVYFAGWGVAGGVFIAMTSCNISATIKKLEGK